MTSVYFDEEQKTMQHVIRFWNNFKEMLYEFWNSYL